VDLFSAIATLFLIMDPLGNVPLFLSVLRVVPPERRRAVMLREILVAYVVLLAFLFAGQYVMRFLQLERATISISGGIVLFLIALRMIFPGDKGPIAEPVEEEPFIVPLAIPFFAGPSTLAALLLLQQSAPAETMEVLLALTIAWGASGVILMASTFFYRVLGERGLRAMERLMGMLLVMLAVQMLVNGLEMFLER
jgi:multiple antibiotic resistance protein